jgi:hypothetical protein
LDGGGWGGDGGSPGRPHKRQPVRSGRFALSHDGVSSEIVVTYGLCDRDL